MDTVFVRGLYVVELLIMWYVYTSSVRREGQIIIKVFGAFDTIRPLIILKCRRIMKFCDLAPYIICTRIIGVRIRVEYKQISIREWMTCENGLIVTILSILSPNRPRYHTKIIMQARV